MATPLYSRPEKVKSSRNQSRENRVFEFKAGRCLRDGETDWVRPDPRRGVCYIEQDEDGMHKFCWEDSKTGRLEESWVVFPHDVSFDKVKESEGRVYLLRYKSSTQRQFFWMQGSDPKQDRATAQQVMSIIDGSASPEDSDIERTMKELINNEYPESENHAESKSGKGKSASGSSKFNEASILAGQKEVSALASETAQKFKRPLSSARVGGDPSNMAFNQISPPNHEDIVASNDQFSDISKLKDFLSSIRVPERPKAKPMDLSKVLTPDVLLPLFQDENLCQALFPYLPEGVPKTVDELEGTVKSPQFVQALRSLSYALESGQMSSLAQSFDLPPVALTSVEDFLKAIKDKFGKEQKNIDQDGDSLMKE